MNRYQAIKFIWNTNNTIYYKLVTCYIIILFWSYLELNESIKTNNRRENGSK
jgi:hypothetical protein